MRKILVPTDFSTCADNAVYFAVQSAKIIQAEITLLHAFLLVGTVYTDYMGVDWEFTQDMLDEAHHDLEKLKGSIEKKERITVNTRLYQGTVTESILQTAIEKNIDLIVMGTLGASGIKEKLWGSETGEIISKSKVPVLAIPFEYKWEKPHKILLVTNHFEKEPIILDFLFELAGSYKMEVHVGVFTNEDEGAINILEHGRKISQYEMMLKEKYKKDTITATHLFGGEFESTLQDYITQNEVNMIAMVTHKRSFLDRIFHPSMTKRMSYHTKIPLLAIPNPSTP